MNKLTPMTNYPQLWKTGVIQRACYRRAGWRCEHCGMEFVEGSTLAKEARRRDGQPMVLTIHHLDGDKHNCSTNNLLACCQKCHLHIQARWKPGQVLPSCWERVPEWITRRGLPYMVQERF